MNTDIEAFFKDLFEAIPITQIAFNTRFPAGQNMKKLEELKKKYPQLEGYNMHIATGGISIESLISTVHKITTGKGLTFTTRSQKIKPKITHQILNGVKVEQAD